MYLIGQLSKNTGVTIRTLDYYDEIGLITPSSSTEGGHRLYDDDNVMRLEQIQSLKYMGFSLQQIRKILKENTSTWEQSLDQQLNMIHQKQKHLEKLERTVQAVLYSVRFEEDVKWPVIFDIIQMFQQDTETDKLFDAYFEPEERQNMKNLDYQMDETDFQEWKEIIHTVRANLNADPGSDIAQQLAKRWMDKVDEMFSGNTELERKMWRAIKDHSDGIVFYPMDKEVVDFIDRASTIMHERKSNQDDEQVRKSRSERE